ncbi:MAG: ADP-forming succinate--CoA ligase subunit beta [Planctomycetota bacterium]|nr:MAG: ADP-forming succinate--CoA ligase subunit beta [Planctomycetota bacterium]
MKVHEYQAKELFGKFGVPVTLGKVATTVEKAVAIAKSFKGPVMVKAQIHAGGRGKGGGVKFCKTVADAKKAAKAILGMKLITHQTGPEGQTVNKVLIVPAGDIIEEFYLAALVDRATAKIAFVVSKEGGVEIEKVAEKTPHKISTILIDPVIGVQGYHVRKMATVLGLKDKAHKKQLYITVLGLYKLLVEKDASLLEINPLCITDKGLEALDGKVDFDDNALFRHPDIAKLRDVKEEEALEVEAAKYSLNYIKLDGVVGCMVNGAGLAMATMDVIKLYGSEPANFLDVGGGATPERVAAAFKILLKDKNVKAVLVNVFGGIVRCDRVAQGIVDAVKKNKIDLPIVVRFSGTNAEEGKAILENSDLTFEMADSLAEAAKKIVKSVKKGGK